MFTVNASADVVGARVEQVWDVVADVERYPSLADHVLEVSPDGPHHRWSVLLNGSRVAWVQRERPVPPRRLDFEQVSGDFEELRGRWTVQPRDGATGLQLQLQVHLGVDGLAALLDPIWAQSFQAHADAVVHAVATAAVATAETSAT
jgi:ribosome-associated toxin RatA of RatAB toxin-antitoxin module